MRLGYLCTVVGVATAMACSTPANPNDGSVPTDGTVTNNDTGGTGNDSGGTGNDSGGTGNDSGGTGNDSGGTGNDSGGTTGVDCAAIANASCSRFLACAPQQFQLQYESEAICREIQTAACMLGVGANIPDTNGVMDQAACTAALNASCDSFFENRPAYVAFPACKPRPGRRALNDRCGVDNQCGTGMNSQGQTVQLYCFGTPLPTVACNNGNCSPPDRAMSGRNTCRNSTTGRDLCDLWNGYQCVNDFRAEFDAGLSGTQCQLVTYGGAGAECLANSTKQCLTGFVCGTNRRCQAVLGMGATCMPNADLCDTRLGLRCLQDQNGQNTCLPPAVVRVGAQCNITVQGRMQVCSNVAICNMATPRVCELRKRLGEPCTAQPDNCFPGLTCRNGMCAAPMPPTCP